MSPQEPDSTGAEAATPSAAPQPWLTTARLVLRPFGEDDAATVQQLLQCRAIAANTRSIDHPYPEGAAKAWISGHAALWERGSSAIFAICEKAQTDITVGAIGLELNCPDENAELGYWLGQHCWGRGYGTEAAREILSFGFSHFGLHKIHANHLVRNPASGRILEKIGMQREGYLRKHLKKWGVFEDLITFGILASEHDTSR